MRSPLCTISSARGGTSFRFSTFSPIHLFLRLLHLFPPISLQHRRLLKRFRILDISFPLLLLLPDLNGLIISSFPVKRKKGKSRKTFPENSSKFGLKDFLPSSSHCMLMGRRRVIVTMLLENGRIGRVGLRRVGGEKLRRPIADEAHRRQFGHCCPTRS